MMREDEKRFANLSTNLFKTYTPLSREDKNKDNDDGDDNNNNNNKKDEIDHKALPLLIYNAARWRFFSTLVRRDTNSTILRGKKWLCLAQFNNFQVNNKAKMCMFRRIMDEKLCFLLTKMT